MQERRMADVVTSEKRSQMMSGIRARDTVPEMRIRRYLHARGYRYRLSDRALPGRPDLVLRKRKAVVFVHGCFWHGHAACRFFRLPATRPDFWREKIESNVRRDRLAFTALQDAGWRVAVVWECALRDGRDAALLRLEEFLQGSEESVEIRSSRMPQASTE